MQHTSFFLLEFFRLLGARGIGYCVMGDTRELPEHIASDVDVVIPQEALTRLPALIDEYCGLYRLRLVQYLQHESNAHYLVFATQGTLPQFLALDICGDYMRNARKLLSAAEIVGSAQPALDSSGRQKGFVGSPGTELEFAL